MICQGVKNKKQFEFSHEENEEERPTFQNTILLQLKQSFQRKNIQENIEVDDTRQAKTPQ